jgi:phospholipid/cholesterol/gamma-HCH transport system substrate-binding protein
LKQKTLNNASVGAVTLVAVTGLLGVTTFRNGLVAQRTYRVKVTFDDVQGLLPKNEVRLAGVKVGVVEKVEISQPDFRRAIATLDIDNQYKIPKNAQFGVRSGLLGGNSAFIVISSPTMPVGALKEGDSLEGDKTSGVDALMANANSVLPPIRTTAEGVSKIVNDKENQANIQKSLEQIKATTAEFPAIAANLKQITAQLNKTLPNLGTEAESVVKNANATLSEVKVAANNINRASKEAENITKNLTRASANADGLVGDVRIIAKENGAELKEVLKQTRESIAGLQGLVAQIGETIADPKIKQNLVETTNNLAATTKKIDQLMVDAGKLTADGQMVSDLKATTANIKETTNSAKEAAASVQKIAARAETIRLPWERRPPDPNNPNGGDKSTKITLLPEFTEPGLTIDTIYDTKGGRFLQSGATKPSRSGRLRIDTNYVFGATGLEKSTQYLRIGLADGTESNRFNLQRGTQKGNTVYRYGLFEGKLGAGIDYHVKSVDLRVDGFDPNNFTVNARLKRLINPSTSLTLGINSLGNGNRPTIGVQMR